jgi:hypothetical protein
MPITICRKRPRVCKLLRPIHGKQNKSENPQYTNNVFRSLNYFLSNFHFTALPRRMINVDEFEIMRKEANVMLYQHPCGKIEKSHENTH